MISTPRRYKNIPHHTRHTTPHNKMSAIKQIELAALEERIRITNSKIAKMQLQVDGWLAELPAAKAAAEEEARSFVLVEKPKKVLTPEHLAKMKAGREAKKAAKLAAEAAGAAAGGAAVLEENASPAVNPEHLTILKTKAAAKKAAKKAEAAAGAEAAAVEKPKKVLTPEHLAKLKAGREAKAAAKKAAASIDDAVCAAAGELIYPPV